MGVPEGTLWEKKGTLRVPCGNLVADAPQGCGLLPQGIRDDEADLVAFSGKAPRENGNEPGMAEDERMRMLAEFRAYLAAEGRHGRNLDQMERLMAGLSLHLSSHGLDCRTLGVAALRSEGEIWCGAVSRMNRNTVINAFVAFLAGKRLNGRDLPSLPGQWWHLVAALERSLAARGVMRSWYLMQRNNFLLFARLQVERDLAPHEWSWDDLEAFGEYLRSRFRTGGRVLTDRMALKRMQFARHALLLLHEDGTLPHLSPLRSRESYVEPPSLVRVPHVYEIQLAAFAEYLVVIGFSRSSVRTYPTLIRHLLSWLACRGILDIREVDERTLAEYRTGPGSLTSTGETASARTRIYRETAICKFFSFLKRTRRIPFDPAAGMERTRAPRSLPRGLLDVGEASSLFDAVDSSTVGGMRDLAMLELLYGCGLRSSELRGLRLDDIQLDDCRLFVCGKGGKESWLPFGEKAARALKLYLGFSRPALAKRGNGRDGGVLFLGQYGRSLTQHALGNLIRRCMKAAGLEKTVLAHGLRHTCATHMIRAGADIRVVQALLRHESINTTVIYTRVMTGDVRDAIRKFHPRENR